MIINTQPIWLVVNEHSGSFDETVVDNLQSALGEVGFPVTRTVCLPEDPLPSSEELDSAGIGLIAMFTGDGTIGSAVEQLGGWSGAVLPLPGGTKNLLSMRLHGDVDGAQIASRLGAELRCGPLPVIRRGSMQAIVHVTAGPGALFYDVREAMRDGALGDAVLQAGDAIGATVAGPFIHCREPRLGREQGYALVEMEATDQGIQIVAYTADTLGGYLEQGWAIMKREFHEGPHEILGLAKHVRLAVDGNSEIALSIDGEPVEGGVEEEFTMADSNVDLIATV